MAESFTSLVEILERSCAKYAARPLFGIKRQGEWAWTSFREIHEQVDACRAGLAGLGVKAGDRVALISANRVEWPIVAYAIYSLGAALVPMYEKQLASEWQFILQDSGAKVAFVARDAIAAQLRERSAELPALEHVIGIESPRSDPASLAALLEAGRRSPVPPVYPEPSAIADIVYTSGTTGKPKGVLLTHGNIASNVNAVHAIFNFVPDDRALSFLPWAHLYGQMGEVHALLSLGCSIAINRDLSKLLEEIAEVRPTVLVAVPRIFNVLYAAVRQQIASKPRFIQKLFRDGIRNAKRLARGERLRARESLRLKLCDRLVFSKVRERFGGRLKYVISGSAALSQEVGEFIDALGLPVYEGYGLTETSPIVTANYPGHRRLGSAGLPIPGVRVVLAKASKDDRDGEIVVYGPNVTQGYYRRPDEDARAKLPDGGFRTGDLGHFDEDGYLYITGRIKEQFKLENGKYVHPVPIEEELKLSPYIANAFVYGDNKPHCVALVVPDAARVKKWAADQGFEPASLATDERVRSLLREEIAARSAGFKGFERLRDFIVVTDDFTTDNGMLTPTLKLKRRNVVAKYQPLLEALYQSRAAVPGADLSAGPPLVAH